MPKISKKKKYNARFPPARIKKIMQTDEEVGKVAAAVPVIISRALELFLESLLKETSHVTTEKNAKTLSTSHIKQTIESSKQFHFLRDLVANVPDHHTEENSEGLQEGDSASGKKPRGRSKKTGQPEQGTSSKAGSETENIFIICITDDEEEDDDESTETDEESKAASMTCSSTLPSYPPNSNPSSRTPYMPSTADPTRSEAHPSGAQGLFSGAAVTSSTTAPPAIYHPPSSTGIHAQQTTGSYPAPNTTPSYASSLPSGPYPSLSTTPLASPYPSPSVPPYPSPLSTGAYPSSIPRSTYPPTRSTLPPSIPGYPHPGYGIPPFPLPPQQRFGPVFPGYPRNSASAGETGNSQQPLNLSGKKSTADDDYDS